MKKVFLFDELMIPGTICFSTSTLNVVSALIRGAEVATEDKDNDAIEDGIEAALDPMIPSHTFLIQEMSDGGNIICSEMTWPEGNNNFIFTEEETLNKLGNHLCGVVRPPCLADNFILQSQATAWMRARHKEGMNYPIGNLLSFLGWEKPDDTRWVCIQYGIAFLIWLQAQVGTNFKIPPEWIDDKNLPKVQNLEAVLEWCNKQGWGRNYYKEVPEDYDPTVPLEPTRQQESKSC